MNTTLKFLFTTIIFPVICCQAQPPGGEGGGGWVRNAYYGEAQTFDK